VSAEMPPPAVPKAGKLPHKQKAPAAFSGAASNAAVVIGSKPPATLPPGCKPQLLPPPSTPPPGVSHSP